MAGRYFQGVRMVAGAALLLGAAQVQAAQPVTGKWLTENGEAVIDIAPCGKALCGKVVKVLKPKPGEKSTVGVAIITGLVDAGSLWKGKILNPASGKLYDAKVQRTANGSLSVQGCLMFICKGPTWTPTS
ncbi:DUF2147 domain-containing protein [Sphingobium sufflavum]|uniref:DUF2147 domain-containing protein n=1 Tax=Sphingobium sufflavum TaxID=1129547 RepID=UPI001F45B8F3|nr:DUF2147 domain-containing protein [Sphingobium sufflavum]MCE7795450.1 DUF2147 domain-containing protein [Sphingobium sufflavum]